MKANGWMGTHDVRIERGEIDPSFVVTHRLPLKDAAKGFRMFLDKEDQCEKVVLAA